MAGARARFYLLLALLSVVLGVAAVVAHLQQPRLPALPGRGCVVTTFQPPETGRVPQPRVEFEACIHISETLYYLQYYSAPDDTPTQVFTATGPEGPEQWREHFRIVWRHPDTLEVAYDSTVQVGDAREQAQGLRILYARVAQVDRSVRP
jgi:hypothetical protein